MHIVILCFGSNCGNSSFRLISKPLGSTNTLLLRLSLRTESAGPILTKIDKVNSKQLSQCNTKSNQTLSFGSGSLFSSSPFRMQPELSSAPTAAASKELFESISLLSPSTGSWSNSGSAMKPSLSGGLFGLTSSSDPSTGIQPSSRGLFGPTSSSNASTGSQPSSGNATASALSGGRFVFGSTSSGGGLFGSSSSFNPSSRSQSSRSLFDC
ncbi:hypothetical protein GGR58DRAFT_493361 [Xylaria digitata]|nr:hypothetical protein GGR58DRAFT_493361 [Xylaria digitata]